MELQSKRTERGFWRAEFTDLYGKACSLQESSLATDAALWLGVDVPDERCGARMHLNQAQVAALLPFLQRFVKTGELAPADE